MPVAYVGGAQTPDGNNYTPLSAANAFLAWFAAMRRNNAAVPASAPTFGATAMTMLASQQQAVNLAGGGDIAAILAHLLNPGTDPETLDLTWPAAPLGEDGFAMTFSGVDQTTPVHDDDGGTYTGTASPSLTHNAPEDGEVIYWRVHRQVTEPVWTDPSGYTLRFEANIMADTEYITMCIWTRDVSADETAVSVSATSDSAGSGGVHGVFALNPSTGGVASIDSADDNFTWGDTVNFTTSNMGPITSRTISDGTNTISLSGTDTTAVLPGLGNGVNRVLGGTVTFELSDGTNTVSVQRTLETPANYSLVTLAAGFNSDISTWVYQWGNPATVGLQALFLTADCTLYDNGAIYSAGPITTTVYVIDPTDGVMQSFDLITGDTTPDVFSFTDLTDVALSTEFISNQITVTGIDTASPISISTSDGMDYRINGGAWTQAAGNVSAGNTVELRVDSSASNNTAVTGTLDIGGVTDEWSVTTLTGAPDTEPPVITRLGSAIVNLNLNDPYVDAGATALDNIDGDITANIVINNPVNTAVPGQYIVTYDVDDAAGNSATQVTRTVNVIDNIAPVITLTGSATVNVNQHDSYVDAGATASDNIDGDITGNIVVNNPVNTAIAGQYIVTFDVTDAAGNSATQVTRTVNVLDTEIPVITRIGASALNITVGTPYNDMGATAVDNLDGDLTGSIVTVNPVDHLTIGQYTVTYDVTDAAGNAAVQVTRIVNIVAASADSGRYIKAVPCKGVPAIAKTITGKRI